jgi:hypothetical protein
MAFLLRLLRLRYLIFGTAVGGGYAAHKVSKKSLYFNFYINKISYFNRNIKK